MSFLSLLSDPFSKCQKHGHTSFRLFTDWWQITSKSGKAGAHSLAIYPMGNGPWPSRLYHSCLAAVEGLLLALTPLFSLNPLSLCSPGLLSWPQSAHPRVNHIPFYFPSLTWWSPYGPCEHYPPQPWRVSGKDFGNRHQTLRANPFLGFIIHANVKCRWCEHPN